MYFSEQYSRVYSVLEILAPMKWKKSLWKEFKVESLFKFHNVSLFSCKYFQDKIMNFNFRSNFSLFYFIFLEYETCLFSLLSVYPVGRYPSFSVNEFPNHFGFDLSIIWPRILFQFNSVNFTIRFQHFYSLLRAKRQLLTKLYQFFYGTSRIDRRSHFRWQ